MDRHRCIRLIVLFQSIVCLIYFFLALLALF